MYPSRKSVCVKPASSASRRALASCASVMSTPITLPSGPAWLAARKLSIPEPLPRSSTVSPGWMAARSRK
jgi:hypothetical protein